MSKELDKSINAFEPIYMLDKSFFGANRAILNVEEHSYFNVDSTREMEMLCKVINNYCWGLKELSKENKELKDRIKTLETPVVENKAGE